jgi:Reverse transcriptase (RNA-dependent DNA polymerase)
MYIFENSSHIIHKRSSPFSDSVDTAGIRQEGENGEMLVNVGSIPLSVPSSIEEQENDEEEKELVCVGTQTQGEMRYVYERRKKQNEGPVPLVSSSPLSPATSTPETPSLSLDLEYTGDMIPLPSPPSPMSLRRTSHSNARIPPDRYGFPHDITQFVSYSNISPTHGTFIASLDSVTLPKKDPKWKAAMLEELRALDKNKTWKLVSLPLDKKTVECKWVFIVKWNLEGKVERYKARLVAKGYSQTYDIDYDETFASMTNMSTMRTLISMTVNSGWKLHQLDVKNVFLYGDLMEEVYMEIPLDFGTTQTMGKVCRLKKSLYGLK